MRIGAKQIFWFIGGSFFARPLFPNSKYPHNRLPSLLNLFFLLSLSAACIICGAQWCSSTTWKRSIERKVKKKILATLIYWLSHYIANYNYLILLFLSLTSLFPLSVCPRRPRKPTDLSFHLWWFYIRILKISSQKKIQREAKKKKKVQDEKILKINKIKSKLFRLNVAAQYRWCQSTNRWLIIDNNFFRHHHWTID